MSTIYTPGTVGPWQADDDLVHADGHQHGFEHSTNGPTVDGLGRARRTRFSADDSNDLRLGRVVRYEDRRI